MPRQSTTDALFEDLMIPRTPLRMKGRLTGEHPAGLAQFDLSGIQWGDPTATIQGAVQTAVDDGYQAFDSWVTSYLNGQSSAGKIDPVPVENQTTREVLAPVSAALQIPAVTNSVTTLQQLGTFLNNGLLKWQAFLDRVAVNYPDGARNSGARLAPYFQGLNATINADLAKLGAAPTSLPGLPGVTVPTSVFAGMSWTTIALLGLGGYLLWKRR